MSEIAKIEKALPTKTSRRVNKKKSVLKEKRLQGWEAAAIAYVQMENGEYKYPDGARKRFDEDRHQTINKFELMRRAGYSKGSENKFDDYMGYEGSEFWELVEYHRIRKTDPYFRRDQQDKLWQEIGNESLKTIYEQVKYSPHTLTLDQHVKVVKLIIDAGVAFQKMGGSQPNRAGELLDSLPEDKREKIMLGYKEKLEKDLEDIRALELAHKAADARE